MNFELVYILPFFITILVEFLINILLIKDKTKKIVLYTILINLFTWPIGSIIYGAGVNFYILEFFIFITEGILLMLLFEIKFKKAFFVSFVGNLVTALLSFIN